MDLKELILEIKTKEGFSNEELAKRLGVNKTTVGRWLKGEVKTLQEETAARLNDLLGFDADGFLKGKAVTFKRPVVGVVKAGYDLFADQNYLGEEEVDYNDYKRGDFFLKVTGNSMIGSGIMNGSMVYVQRTDSLENGEIGVFLVGDEVTVKRIEYQPETVILEASNPEVPNRYFSKKEVEELPLRVLGKLLYCKTSF